MALTVAGFDVTGVSTGANAIATAVRTIPDLVCVDVALSDVDGLEVLEALRAHPATSHIPVIVTASASRRSVGPRAYHVGADDFVVKPVDPLTFGVRAIAAVQRRATAAA